MECLACSRIDMIRANRNDFFLAELRESYVVLAANQRYYGYSILLLKEHYEHLHMLPRE